jgi:SAM-dependent MidA family methyltransferase
MMCARRKNWMTKYLPPCARYNTVAEQSDRLQALCAFITSCGGALSFAHFMNWCLYDPQWGYYMSARKKIGMHGDYYTCAQVGDVLGHALARAIDTHVRTHAPRQPIGIVEWGGGEGNLAQAMLRAIDAYDWAPSVQFVGIERSPSHRARMASKLAHAQNVTITDDERIAEQMMRHKHTIVVANELLDAMPVYRVRWDGTQWYEHVVRVAGDQLVNDYVPLKKKGIYRWIEQYGVHVRIGQTIEIPLHARAWVRRVGNMLRSGGCVCIDYGDDSDALLRRGHEDGSIRGYYEHMMTTDMCAHIGEQDMTYDINTTWMTQWASESGFSDVTLMMQKDFVVQYGALERISESAYGDPFGEDARRNRAIVQLVSPIVDRFWVCLMWNTKQNTPIHCV